VSTKLGQLHYRFDAATGKELKAIPDEFEEFVAQGSSFVELKAKSAVICWLSGAKVISAR